MTDKKKFYYPPAPPSGAGTFNDDLVGFQYTKGSAQMTLGNFNITDSSSSSQDREFNLGGFSGPITLEQGIFKGGSSSNSGSTILWTTYKKFWSSTAKIMVWGKKLS